MEEALQVKPFAFRRRFERVDWRKLASVNLDQIARDLDFGSLQENLTNIAFCNIELELDLRLIDPNFVKLFRMGQLTIEYLLYSQEYLSDTIVSLEGRVKEQHKNEENLLEKVRIIEKQLEKTKKEGHKRKKLIMDQQHLIEAGADNFHKCLLCPKAFMNSTFLQNHCIRRHGQTYQQLKEEQQEAQIPPKICEQLEEIKQRLIFTESQLSQERKSLAEASMKETSLLAERDALHQKKLEEWREESELQHRKEINKIQDILLTQLKEMQEKQLATQKALEAAQLNRPSNLGEAIHDDLDVEREIMHREREELLRLKEELKLQRDNIPQLIQDELAAQENAKVEASANQEPFSHTYSEKARKELKKRQREINELKRHQQADHRNGSESAATDGRPELSRSTTSDSHRPLSNGLLDTSTEPTEKKKKTLTFAVEADVVDAMQSPVNEKAAVIPMTKESPVTPATLSSEEDTESDSHDNDTTLVDATSTNQSWSTLGTLDLTAQSKELEEAITHNPKLLQDMKLQLQQVFHNELQRWGVSPDDEGISATQLSAKQQHLAKERNKMEKKYKDFRETRVRLIKQVDDLARNELEQSQGRPSPKDQKKLANTSSTLTATVESSSWGTTSSKWSSAEKRDQPVLEISTDDESSSSSDESLPKYKPVPQAVQKQQPSSSLVKQSPISPVSETPAKRSTGPGSEGSKQSSVWNTVEDDVDQGGFTPSATKPSQRPIQLPGVDTRAGTDEGSDWDEDDLSELEDIGNGATSASILRASTDSTIRDRAALIESQLMGRKGKAPAGGINTLTVPTEVTSLSNQTAESEDEDSLEAELAAHTTTNTYSSRQWGQGSAANTLSASGKQGSSSLAPSGEKASSVTSENVSLTTVTGTAQKGDSGSDWSDDIDLCDL